MSYPPYNSGPKRSANGVLILILGIGSFLFCQFLGPVAWILGNNALRDINSGMADESELGLVQAGRIIGIVATVLMALGLCFFVLVFGGLISIAGMSSGLSR